MSAQNNAPLTPPLTENDVQQLLGSQSRSQTSASTNLKRPARSSFSTSGPTEYLKIFPSLTNFALQNQLSALIELAEIVDLNADSASHMDESRLLLVAPLILSYIITDELPPARIALSRLPESLSVHSLSRALLKLLASVQNRSYSMVYKSAETLVDVVQESDFFDKALTAVIKVMTERLLSTFRHKTMLLLAKAYTTIRLSVAQSYLDLAEDDIVEVSKKYNWTYDPSNQTFIPSRFSSTASVPLSGGSTSSLTTVKLVISGAAQLELRV
ncbi:hypothetical protein DFH11DRAFT_1579038 [Phellopilus nigrolimitatus]|nr:hypothetical protein DFH11DRAFT_1579038 [Phellopilus nigrolimitatus]